MNAAAAARRQQRGELRGLGDIPAARGPVRAGDPHRHRPSGGEGLAHGLEHLEWKPHAVLQRPAVVVAAPIRQRRKELVQQVAVGAVDLDGGELQPGRPRGRISEGLANPDKVLPVQLSRGGLAVLERQG